MPLDAGRDVLTNEKTVRVPLLPEQAFSICRIGGKTGWYYGNGLWRIRGLVDLLMGGVGMRRGRLIRTSQPGSTLDFWRVELYEPGRRLRLFAECVSLGAHGSSFAPNRMAVQRCSGKPHSSNPAVSPASLLVFSGRFTS